MKKFLKITAAILTIGLAATFSQPAYAGQLATGNATISWDASTFYYPSSCSSFTFSYTNGPQVNFGNIKVKNKYGDTLGAQMTSGAQGNAAMQICNMHATPSDAPFTVEFEVHQKYSGGGDGSTSVVSSPLVFLQRGSSSAQSPAANNSNAPVTGQLIYVCVNKKNFSVVRSTGKSCASGWILKSFR